MKQLKKSKEKKSFRKNISDVFRIENRKPYLAIVLISFIFNFATGTGYSLMEKYIADTPYIDKGQYTAIAGLLIPSILIAFIGNSFLLDKIGRRAMILVYSIILPISGTLAILAALHPTMALPLFAIFTVITNIAFYGIGITLRIVTLEYLPTEHRGTGLGLRGLISAIGGTVGLLIGSMLILVLELGPTMIILTLLVFIIIPLGIKYLKETKDVELSQIK
jgi:MFS family permease